MQAQSSGTPDSDSPSPVSSTSTDGKLPSVQQILPSLLGLHNWSLGSALNQAGAQNPTQAHNHGLSRNSSAASQFLFANQALQGLQAQQFQSLQSNASGQLVSVPMNAANQAQMILNNNHLLTSALAGLTNSNSQNSQNGVALVNHFQMQQLLNNGLSSNQLLSALSNQLLANAAAQSGLQMAQSGMLGQSVIRRVGKPAPVHTVESSHPTSGSSFIMKMEDSEDEAEESLDNSENGMDDKDDDRSNDRGPTIAQLTSSTASVIRSTKGSAYAHTGKASYVSSTKKSASPPTSSSSPTSALMSLTSPANSIRHLRHDKSVICTTRSAVNNVVDGIDLEEIREFAKRFKLRRLSLGLTQTQVGQALSATEGPSYSQSAICRFEKLDITPRSAQKIKPVLERWMKEAEERYENGGQNLAEFVGCEPNKKRKRRTSFTPQALEILNAHFEKNTHPSGAEVTTLADELNYDREVVRVWFCNKRQALKNTIKKIKNSSI